MIERDGLQNEMRRLLLGELASDPLAIDQDTADRLLAGRLDPADAPPGYAEVARVLATAAAPALPHELDGEAATMTAFGRERLHRRGADSHAAPRRWLRGSRLAVAAAAVAVLMVGGVAAAATGAFPEPAQRLVDSISRTAQHLEPSSASRQGDVGGARNRGQDRPPAVSGGHASGQPSRGRHTVGPGSGERGATGKANQGAHGASKALPGGAHGKSRSVASHAASKPPANHGAEGHRKEKGK